MFRPTCIAALLVALSACGGPIVATETVDHSFTTTTNPRVIVRTFDGHIDVTSGVADSVVATVKKKARGWSDENAQRNLTAVVVTFQQDGDTITIEAGKELEETGIADGADVQLVVPAGATLDLTSSNGTITADGTQSDISAGTSNGDVVLSGGAGTLRASTSNGSIRLSPYDAATVTASSSNGDVSFQGKLRTGASTFDTSNGDIDLYVPADSAFHLDAETSNGTASCGLSMVVHSSTASSLRADIGEAPTGDVHATSSNGSIRVMPLGTP